MSAMGRLATDMVLDHAGLLPEKSVYTDTLVRLGYEPDESIGELDVFDPERAAYGALVRCEGCDHVDTAPAMIAQQDGDWLCPSCDGAQRADYDDYLRVRGL